MPRPDDYGAGDYERVMRDLAQSTGPWSEHVVHEAWVDEQGNLGGMTTKGWEV